MSNPKNKIEKVIKEVKNEIETFTLTDDEGQVIEFSVKRPGLSTYSRCLRYLMPGHGEADYISAGEIILNDGFCGGDPRVLQDDELKLGACIAVCQLITIKTFELKKK